MKKLLNCLIFIFVIETVVFSGIAHAVTLTSGGTQEGRQVQEKFMIHQNKYADFATDLHYKLWQKEDNIEVNGWKTDITHFSDQTSQRGNQPPGHSKGSKVENHPSHPKVDDEDNGQHAIDVTAKGAQVPYCSRVTIDATFWLVEAKSRKPAFNTKHLYGVNWTKENDPVPEKKAIPDNGWEIWDPIVDPLNSGQYLHKFVLTNDDPNLPFWVTDLQFLASYTAYVDLDVVPFSNQSLPDFLLNPGESFIYNFPTVDAVIGGYIYGKFNLRDDIGGVPSTEIAATDRIGHQTPIPEPSTLLLLLCGGGGVVLFSLRRKK